MRLSSDKVNVRRAKDSDADLILKVHYDSVHFTAVRNYEQAIINEWAPPITPERIKNHRIEFKKSQSKSIIIVAEILNDIIGFGIFVPATKEISAVYVSPHAGRKGVGAMILAELENIARQLGVNQVSLQATLNAESFYLKNEFIRESTGEYIFPSGTKMFNIKMYKNI